MAKRSAWPRRLVALLAVFAGALAFVLGGVQPATADELPPPPESGDQYDRWTNGCTGMPDAPFTIACNEHDLCYGGFMADPNDPSRPASRQWCDNQFFVAMGLTCIGAIGWLNPAIHGCMTVAGTYYLGVRAVGSSFYDPDWACREFHSNCWF